MAYTRGWCADMDIVFAQELQAVKNNMIGEDVDGAVSGISGGERRRVSVGIGLVTDARAIFLDEPTTGLDSDSAEQLIALLSHLAAHKHRTVNARCHIFYFQGALSTSRMLECSLSSTQALPACITAYHPTFQQGPS